MLAYSAVKNKPLMGPGGLIQNALQTGKVKYTSVTGTTTINPARIGQPRPAEIPNPDTLANPILPAQGTWL